MSLPSIQRQYSESSIQPNNPKPVPIWRSRTEQNVHAQGLRLVKTNTTLQSPPPTEVSPLLADETENECYANLCYAPKGLFKRTIIWCAENFSLLGLCVIACFLTAGEIIFRKIVATNMFHYRWFCVQFISFLTTSTLLVRHLQLNYLCIQTAKSSKAESTRKDSDLQLQNLKPSKEKKWLSYKHCFIIAFLDAVHQLLIFIPIGILPGQVISILPLLVFPLTMIFECFSCEIEIATPSYSWSNYFGVIFLLTGIFVTIVPGYEWKDYIDSTESVGNILLLTFAAIPSAIVTIYKRVILVREKYNVYTFNLQLSVLQYLCTWLIAPLALRIQYLNSNEEWSYAELPFNFIYGFSCLFGYNHYPTDQCSDVSYLIFTQFFIYLIFLFTSILLSYYLMQQPEVSSVGSNAIFLLGTIIAFCLFYCPSISNLYQSSSDFILYHSNFTWFTLLGISLVIFGFILENSLPEDDEFDIDDDNIWFQSEHDDFGEDGEYGGDFNFSN